MNATENLHIEPWGSDTYLVGRCWDNSRGWNESWLNLDSCLGDSGGRFQWGGSEFTDRARNISFNPTEGGSRVPVLRAELRDDSPGGNFLEGNVNLAEKINNRDGNLQFSRF
ncbi:hypothetical protein N7447_011167 [Penicillium robsamsonii]|uniref:uncharacterized protein n=1 Tax=Penicillium robsamsonii TaxID=1792511 RepID=UPI002546E1FB|nr:uncharacterized protein N7447_011167 [Penicillium robsamsonii]KAJ5807711.1 hypothetical protein N7447_011167 [Penicillium robsamsonii]